MITPAISVLSAVEGLDVATPVFTPYLVLITVVVLVGLFLVQGRGTGRIGQVFGPIMLLWFLAIGVLGLLSIVQSPHILEAMNPVFGMQFLVAHPAQGFVVLGSVFLALTGAEALYADMDISGRDPSASAGTQSSSRVCCSSILDKVHCCCANPTRSPIPFICWPPPGSFSRWWGWPRSRPSSPPKPC